MAPGGAKMTADVEAAPVIGLRRNGRRLERHHRRPFISLGVLCKRQRDQHAAAKEPTPNEPMPHQAPRYPVGLLPRRKPPRQDLLPVAGERKLKGKIMQSL